MNGASEATLQDLLAVAQAMNTNLVNLNRLIGKMGGGGTGGSSSSGAGGGTASIPPLGPAAIAANLALGGLKVATSAVSGVFNVLGSIVGQTVGGLKRTGEKLFEFAKMAADGRAKLSDFYDSFSELPFLVGKLFGIFADVIRYQERMIDSYITMTRAGATFSGSLTQMRDMATKGYLTLGEMSKIVRANSEVFATMGGDVDSGLRKFIDVQNKLMGPGSQYSKQLLGLGYTSESVAELLGAVYQQQANLNKQDLQNSNRVAEAVAMTAKELDLFSRATGKNREELEKELKQKSFDAAWKTFTQGMTPEQAKLAEAAIAKALSIGGQGAADGIKQMFMTGGQVSVPINDAMKEFYVQTNGAAEDFYQTFYRSVMNSNLTDQQRLEVQLRATRDIGAAYNDFKGSFGEMGGILSMMGNRFVNNMPLMNSAMRFATLTNAEISKMAREAALNQKKASEGTAGSLMQAELNIKNFGMTIMNLVNELIGPIAGYLIKFGDTITNELTPIFNNIISWFKSTFDDLGKAYTKGGFEGLFRKLFEKIGEGIQNVQDILQPLWESMKPAMISMYNDYVKPFLSSVFTGIMDFIISNLRKNSKIARFLFDETESERKERERMEADPLYQRLLEVEKQRVAAANAAAGELGTSTVDYEEVARQYRENMGQQRRATADEQKAQRAYSRWLRSHELEDIPTRHSGTLGVTGNWWEKENKVVEVQAGETVATPSQLAQIVDAASQKGLPESIQALNSTMRTLIAISQRIEENTKETVRATKSLNNDVFQTV